MTTTLRTVILATALVGLPGAALAEHRVFTKAETSATTTPGDTLLLIGTEQRYRTSASDSPSVFGLDLTVQHGITDRWDLMLHHVFEQSTGDGSEMAPGEAVHLAELAAHTRYRTADRGALPVDVVLSGHLHKFFGESRWEIMPELTLSRDLGRATAAVNAGIPVQFGSDVAGAEVMGRWAAGISYQLPKQLTIGAESWGELAFMNARGTLTHSIGPAASWAPTPTMSVVATAGFGTTAASDQLSVGALVVLGL